MPQIPIQAHLDNPGDPLTRMQFTGNVQEVITFINNEYPVAYNDSGELIIYGEDGTNTTLNNGDWLSK